MEKASQTGISRRDMLGAGAVLAGGAAAWAVPAQARAQPAPSAHAPAVDTPEALSVPGAQRIDLWAGKAPGDIGTAITPSVQRVQFGASPPDRWVRGVAQPYLLAFRPERPDGSAALIMPGGGYAMLSFDKEGVTPARWLAARGTTAFVLVYRLPGEGWADHALVPLQDAQRALRLIRARARDFGVEPARVMVMGFSAGGHLAGSLTTRYDERAYAPRDEADALSARPDLAALIYPVVSMLPGLTHEGSRDLLLGRDAPASALHGASVEEHVTEATAPLFLTHAMDDGTVPVGGTLGLFAAAREKKRIVELNVVARGGHGFGMELPAREPGSLWPQLLERFAVSSGVLGAGTL
jgi:acetyl esterase/lipase